MPSDRLQQMPHIAPHPEVARKEILSPHRIVIDGCPRRTRRLSRRLHRPVATHHHKRRVRPARVTQQLRQIRAPERRARFDALRLIPRPCKRVLNPKRRLGSPSTPRQRIEQHHDAHERVSYRPCVLD